MKVKLITCLITFVIAAAVGFDSYQRYQRAVNLSIPWNAGLDSGGGSVQVAVPQDAAGVITQVSPGCLHDGSFSMSQSWCGKPDSKPLLRIRVILPTPVAEPPDVVGAALGGSAQSAHYEGESGQAVSDGILIGDGRVIVALADGVDPETGGATASMTVEISRLLRWCQGSQCFVLSPTVLLPVVEPSLRSANGDPQATRGSWGWAVNPDPLHRDEPQVLSGTQQVDAGYIPATATVASISPPLATQTGSPNRLLWSSESELYAQVKYTDDDLEATRQNDVFIAGVEVGVATALFPWGLQLLLELVSGRSRGRRRTRPA